MAKCDHRYEDGTSCRSPEAFVDPDTGLCRQHGPGAAERMAEQGRKGALATKKRFGGISLPSDRLGPLETIHDAQRWLRLIAGAVGARQLTHSEGQSMTVSVREWVKAESERLKVEDLEELRAQVAELQRLRSA